MLRDNVHWLQMQEWILFKLYLTAYKALPAWHHLTERNHVFPLLKFSHVLHCSQLHMAFCLCHQTRRELGKGAFAVAGPAAWNDLPDNVWSALTRNKFKQHVKTHLFRQSFCI